MQYKNILAKLTKITYFYSRPSQSSGEVEVDTESANSSRSEGRFVSMLTRPQVRETRANNSNNSVPPQGCVPAPEVIDLDPIEERGFPGLLRN